jgi:hypothetical protein
MKDGRNLRELTIAFTAMVTTWSIAGGLFAARLLFGYEVESLDGPAAMIGDWLALEGALR